MFHKAREYNLGACTLKGDMQLYKQHGAYIVNGWNSEGEHVAKGFNTLRDAKAWMRKQTKYKRIKITKNA